MLDIPTLRKPGAVLTAMCAGTEFSTQDLKCILTRVSPQHAEEALRQIRRGTIPLLGTIVRLLEMEARDSDRIFIARAYERLLARHSSEENLLRYEQGLTSAFLSRAEIVQELITSAEFQELLRYRLRRPQFELASLSRIEAFLIDRVRAAFQPHRLQPPAHMRWRVGEGPWDVYGRHFE